ncbi:MAG: hypothetical protein DMF84_20870 [Acidobacteria bacterium]|nr:MAG: hypothetical protein DMF84_20870 [Acidobacteriota bacterium]
MRIANVVLLLVATMTSLIAQDTVIFRDDAAASLFRTSRMNMSGREATIRELLALHMTGRIRIATPDGAAESGTTDIKVLLPDRYLRVDSTPGATRYSGFDRDILLSAIKAGDSTSTVPDALRAAALQSERRRLAYLMIGATTYVSADLSPVIYSAGYGADVRVVEAIDANRSFLLRLVFGESMLPTRLEYPGGTMTFADRRVADGLQMPFRITSTGGNGRLVDEITFETVRVNGDLSSRDFKITVAQ